MFYFYQKIFCFEDKIAKQFIDSLFLINWKVFHKDNAHISNFCDIGSQIQDSKYNILILYLV